MNVIIPASTENSNENEASNVFLKFNISIKRNVNKKQFMKYFPYGANSVKLYTSLNYGFVILTNYFF